MEEGGRFVLKIREIPPAPEAIVELVQCGCEVSKCSTFTCSCKRHGLPCTRMCKCDGAVETCINRINPLHVADLDSFENDEAESDI